MGMEVTMSNWYKGIETQRPSVRRSQTEEETTTQWPQLESLHYRCCLKASRVHVIQILPPAFHRCQMGNGATESKFLPTEE